MYLYMYIYEHSTVREVDSRIVHEVNTPIVEQYVNEERNKKNLSSYIFALKFPMPHLDSLTPETYCSSNTFLIYPFPIELFRKVCAPGFLPIKSIIEGNTGPWLQYLCDLRVCIE